MQITIKHVAKDHPLPTPAKITASEPVLFIYDEPYYPQNPMTKYWMQCFNCGLISNLGSHTIEINGDKISLSPSLLCPRTEPFCGAHYYVKNNEVIQA